MPQDSEILGFLRAFRRIARALDQQSGRINRQSGLTLPQLVVLTCLKEAGEVTGRRIAEAADLSPPTVVGILDKLAEKGLIERYRSARDRRIVHARLTARGAALVDAAPAPMGEDFAAGLARLDPAERRAMLALLDRLVALTGTAADPAAAPADAAAAGPGAAPPPHGRDAATDSGVAGPSSPDT